MKHMCPVCGYREMKSEPKGYEICSCCGTEFELDDVENTIEELRDNWIASGAKWFDVTTQKPVDWNPLEQLAEAGMLNYSIHAASPAPVTQPLVLRKKAKPIYERG